MYHYLFTNDLRVTTLSERLKDAAERIATDSVPSANENKSLNNNIMTLSSYFNLMKDNNCTKLARAGFVRDVVMNFICKFQFPNVRTKDSFDAAISDGIRIAPMRTILQLLYAMRLIDESQAYLTDKEILDFVFYNDAVAKSVHPNIYEIGWAIFKFRQDGVYPQSVEQDPNARIWKHQDRQIREFTNALEWAGCLSRNPQGALVIKHDNLLERDKAHAFTILSTMSFWNPPSTTDFGVIKESYRAYMDCESAISTSQPDEQDNESSVDCLSVALKLFARSRIQHEWCADNTEGDTSKPRAGYVANLQLRKFLNDAQTQLKLAADDAGNVRAWFKEYWDPDTGKNWLGDLTDAELKDFGPYVCDLIQPSAHKPPRPPKFSLSLEAAVNTVIKPGESCFYDKRVHNALKFLGLTDGEFSSDFTDEDYQLAKSAQIVLKRRLKKLIPNGQIVEWDAAANPPAAKENNQEPDFLAVNEFLWFVKMHLNEIENKIVEKKMEPAKHKELPNEEKNKKPVVNMGDSDDVLLLRLRAALRTKPFVILAGHSGTGKSRMVRKLAYMTCNDEALRKDKDGVELKEPGNFKMIQVKPNWHDSCDLLGYYSELGKRYRASEFVKFICKAYAYPKTPFFVCLDEMNLAPVEQYFAEYLSAIESRKLQGDVMTTDELVPKTAYVIKDDSGTTAHYDWLGCETTEASSWLENYGLTIPRNLFVVGTVNMDESTNQFSRKVLDRAMTIEMTDADFDAFGKQPPELNFANVPYMGDDAVADLLAGKVQATTLGTEQKKKLNDLKSVLSSTSFAVAYRFANEYALYEEALKSTVALSVKPVEGGGEPQTLELSGPGEVADAAATGSSGAAAEATAETAAETPAATSAAAKKPAIPSAFDDMVLMKVLPRISGDEADVKRIFYEGPTPDKQSPRPSETAPAENTLLKLLGPKQDTASVRKIKWILARGGSYLSFWP